MIAGQPIPYNEWDKFYKDADNSAVKEVMKNSFVVHYWSHYVKDSSVAYVMEREHLLYKIFEANCPLTEQHLLGRLIGFPY